MLITPSVESAVNWQDIGSQVILKLDIGVECLSWLVMRPRKGDVQVDHQL